MPFVVLTLDHHMNYCKDTDYSRILKRTAKTRRFSNLQELSAQTKHCVHNQQLLGAIPAITLYC